MPGPYDAVDREGYTRDVDRPRAGARPTPTRSPRRATARNGAGGAPLGPAVVEHSTAHAASPERERNHAFYRSLDFRAYEEKQTAGFGLPGNPDGPTPYATCRWAGKGFR